jgi:hypothetical protein
MKESLWPWLAAAACSACIGSTPAAPAAVEHNPPPLPSEVCAERVVSVPPDSKVAPGRAQLILGWDGDRLLDLNLGGCLFSAPASGQAWSVAPGVYTITFSFSSLQRKRATLHLIAGQTKTVLVTVE